jgi:hypothetical protein
MLRVLEFPMNSFLDALSKAFTDKFLFISEDYFDNNLLRHVSRGKVRFDRLCPEVPRGIAIHNSVRVPSHLGHILVLPHCREKDL